MESKHRVHPTFTIVPAMNLGQLAQAAFIGARFHLGRVKEYVNRTSMQTMWREDSSLDEATKNTLASEEDQFHWHVRAFLWELVASYDTILQWANQRYELGFQEDAVKWRNITKRSNKAKKDQLDWNRKYAMLEDAWNSDWFFEVRQYRNFAHRASIATLAEYGDSCGEEKLKLKKIWLTPAREGQQEYVDIVTQLSAYLENMRELGEHIFAPLRSGNG